MSDDTSEWITIPEAAARLHVAERQARRLVSRLPETERTAEGVRPAKVRWCPDNVRHMGAPRGYPLSEVPSKVQKSPDNESEPPAPVLQAAPDPTAIAADLPANTSEISPDMSEKSPDRPDSAMVDQLRSEIAYLRSELTATREGRDVAEAELRRLMLTDRDELQRMRARLALPEAPPPQQPTPDPEPQERTNWLQRTWNRMRRKS